MEAMGFFECIEFLKNNDALQFVTHFCTDRDCSVTSEFEKNPDLKHIKLVYDPGHVMKGCLKDLEKIFGKGKRYVLFPAKIAKWFLLCVKKAEELHNGKIPEMQKEYVHRMSSAVAHYTCKVCKPSCPCRDKRLIQKPPHELLKDDDSLFSRIPLELQQNIYSFIIKSTAILKCLPVCRTWYHFFWDKRLKYSLSKPDTKGLFKPKKFFLSSTIPMENDKIKGYFHISFLLHS
jgi:hypothetical protein